MVRSMLERDVQCNVSVDMEFVQTDNQGSFVPSWQIEYIQYLEAELFKCRSGYQLAAPGWSGYNCAPFLNSEALGMC